MTGMKLEHLPLDTLDRIVALARAARQYRDARAPKHERGELLVIHSGADFLSRPIPNRAESWGPCWVTMLAIVEALPRLALAELAALMWYGRGDGSFAALRREAIAWDDPHRAIYVCAKVPLADYLERAVKSVDRRA
jgi:uncharacterized protein DUF3775